MRINNNMMAMNTQRQLNVVGGDQAKSMEKLSSGYRINRAGDDAAGLAISEKMRAQVRGLNQASRNAQDGISLIQTAEGALTETHAILQRMRELSVQSSNDTNVSVDRGSLQDEVSQLKSEIDRIGETTEFNTQKLLQGDGKVNLKDTGLTVADKLTGGVNASKEQASRTDTLAAASADTEKLAYTINGETLTITFGNDTGLTGTNASELKTSTGTSAEIGIKGANTAAMDSKSVTDALNAMIEKNDTLRGSYKVTEGTGGAFTIEAIADSRFDGVAGSISVGTHTTTASLTADAAPNAGVDNAAVASSTNIALGSLVGASDAETQGNIEDLVGTGMTINGQQIEFYNANDGAYEGDAIGVNISDALTKAGTASVEQLVDSIVEQVGSAIDGITVSEDAITTSLKIEASVAGKDGDNIKLADGGKQEDFKAEFQIGANQGQTMEVTVRDMRSEALGVKSVDISTKDAAKTAITTINDAIESVSKQRSELGAVQNRLEHTIKNLDTSAENLQAAESRIRDVDMAKEMMEFTKNNILSQAAQSMLAQANQSPQGVLQLLR